MTNQAILAAADALMIAPATVRAVFLGTPDPGEARTRWEALRKSARGRFRRLALELHPDRNAGDERKAEQLRAVIEVYRQFEKLTFEQLWTMLRAPVQRPQAVIRIVYNGGFSTATSTNTVTSCW